MPSSRGSSWLRDWTRISYVSCIGRWVLYHQCHQGSPQSIEDTNKTSSLLLKCVNSGMQQVYTEKENYILLPLTVKWITSVEALKMLRTIDRWMDKEVVVHIHNGMLLSHKKEWIWVNCNEVGEPRACYSGWSKSEKQILYIKAYIWNLEKQYWWTYLQGRNGDTDTKSGLGTQQGKERLGRIEKVALTYIHYHV